MCKAPTSLPAASTTGRPRRVGHIDLFALRYICQLSGVTELAVTKLDVLDDFDEIAEKTRAASRNNPQARAYQRYFFASADEQRPDGQGRITLSPDHRSYARLTKECVVIGSVDYLEIWDSAAWQDYQQSHEENFSAATDEALHDII